MSSERSRVAGSAAVLTKRREAVDGYVSSTLHAGDFWGGAWRFLASSSSHGPRHDVQESGSDRKQRAPIEGGGLRVVSLVSSLLGATGPLFWIGIEGFFPLTCSSVWAKRATGVMGPSESSGPTMISLLTKRRGTGGRLSMGPGGGISELSYPAGESNVLVCTLGCALLLLFRLLLTSHLHGPSFLVLEICCFCFFLTFLNRTVLRLWEIGLGTRSTSRLGERLAHLPACTATCAHGNATQRNSQHWAKGIAADTSTSHRQASGKQTALGARTAALVPFHRQRKCGFPFSSYKASADSRCCIERSRNRYSTTRHSPALSADVLLPFLTTLHLYSFFLSFFLRALPTQILPLRVAC